MSSDWAKSKIRSELLLRGINLTDIDRAAGMQTGSCSKALNRPWARLQNEIAKRLSIDPWVIWPSRYDQDNNPIDRRGKSGKQQRVGT